MLLIPRPFRETLLRKREEHAQVILAIQKYRSPFLDKFMHAVTLAGHEEFYILMLSVFLWTVDSALGQRLMILLPFCIYTANFVKNTYEIPRPPSPPVWFGGMSDRENDYGFLSTHATTAWSLPLYIAYYFYRKSPDQQNFPVAPVLTLVFVWAFLLCLSRLYLGVHSPADIVCGACVGLLIFFTFTSLESLLFQWIKIGPHDPRGYSLFVNCFFLAIFFMTIHPDRVGLKTYGESCIQVGTGLGTIIGSHLHARAFGSVNMLWSNPVMDASSSGLAWHHISTATLRLALGVPVLVASLIIGKMLFNTMFSFVYVTLRLPHVKYGEPETRPFEQPKGFTLRIDAPVRCLTYGLMTVIAIYVFPAIFYRLEWV